jgi:hypothetical protein
MKLSAYDTRARGGQEPDASGQRSASAATQTMPRFGPALDRSERCDHPILGCVRLLDHAFVLFDPSGHTSAGWVALLKMA